MKAFKQLSSFLPLSCLSICMSFSAIAEVHVLEDHQLSDYSGQAGLTVDLANLSPSIEFEYVDAGHHAFSGIHIGGQGAAAGQYYTDELDNLRVNISLAGNGNLSANEDVEYGFSELRQLAETYLSQGNQTSREAFETLAQGYDPLRNNLTIDERQTYDEGDLVVHLDYLDAFEKDGGFEAFQNGDSLSGNNFYNSSMEDAQALASKAIDFSYSINEVDMAFGSNLLGFSSSDAPNNSNQRISTTSSTSGSTRLMSNFHIQGYLGPHDLHLKEFTRFTESGMESSSTGITWNSYFKVTDLDVYLDIAGIQISDVQIHNNRGDLSGINLDTQDNSVGNSSFGFAHAQREIYSLDEGDFFSTDFTNDEDDEKKKKKGIAFNTRFKGDIDIGHLSFGDTDVSIGEFYITDFYFNRRLKISPRE